MFPAYSFLNNKGDDESNVTRFACEDRAVA